jgi:hypothetical protein
MQMAWVKPDIVDVSGTPIVEPPFIFREVTTRVFPLKANMSRLTQFCNEYLNMDIPPDIVRFTPALPYVYLMVLNYGSMSAESVTAQNAGWVAQYEVTFTVPLRRWRCESGRLAFKGWASVSPFIYVDDQLSQMTGREVYGWPKVLSKIASDVPLWSTHPRKPTRLFTLSAPIFHNAYAGEEEKISPLIQIDYNPPGTFSEFPVDPWNPWSPLSVIPNALRNSQSLMGEGLDLLLSQRIRGFQSELDLPALLAMAWKGGKYFRDFMPQLLPSLLRQRREEPERSSGDAKSREKEAKLGLPKFLLDNITLKQFRDPERPELACYQALVNSKMGVNRINEAGLLGDPGLLRGDPSGGYTIRLHQYSAHPIIEVLGIEVPGINEDAERGPIAILKPTFPIWSDTDLWYGKGNLICSRTNYLERAIEGRFREDQIRRGRWFDDTLPRTKDAHPAIRELSPILAAMGQIDPAAAEQKSRVRRDTARRLALTETETAAAKAEVDRARTLEHAAPALPNYNTALGAATQAISGPFHFPDMHIQVYPLLADQSKLTAFVDWYLNKTLKGLHPRQSFKVAGSYVYLAVSVVRDKLGTMWSATNNIGWWAEREVSFCVPVKWYQSSENVDKRTAKKIPELISAAIIEPFVYANSDRAVITDREVNGRSSFHANINSPYDVWNAEGPPGNRKVLHMETEIFSAINAGQKSTKGALLEIDVGDEDAPADEQARRAVREGWGSEAAEDLERKTFLASIQEHQIQKAKSLALEILANREPINRISLKQYRDSEDISKACYQAVVHTERSITQLYNFREIKPPVHVRLTRVFGHPIVEKLGLKVKSVDSRRGHLVENLQPIHPFWMHVAMKEELGRVIGTVVTVDTKGRRHILEGMSDEGWREAAAAIFDDGRTLETEADLPKDRWTKVWVQSHPWLLPDSAPSSDTVASNRQDKPFFRMPGDTRVGLSLVALADKKHHPLTTISKNWLRRSLTNEMTLFRLGWENVSELIERYAEDEQFKQLAVLQIEDLKNLMAARSVGDFCSATPITRLLALSAALADKQGKPSTRGPALDLEPLVKWLRPTGEHRIPDEECLILEAWIGFKLEHLASAAEKFASLRDLNLEAAGLVLSSDVLGRIRDLEKLLAQNEGLLLSLAKRRIEFLKTTQLHGAGAPFADIDQGPHNQSERHALRDARGLIEPLTNAYNDWKDGLQGTGWRRLTREDARNAIDELEEAQVVLESILRSEWENNGKGDA